VAAAAILIGSLVAGPLVKDLDARILAQQNALFRAGVLTVEGGPDARAIADLEDAVGKNRDDRDLVYLLGIQYKKAGRYDDAAALYREILRDMFAAVARRVAETARSSADPADKIRAFVEAIAVEAEARPHFPPIWFREIAEGGAHLDAATVAHIATVLKTLGAIVKEGIDAHRFRPVKPLLVHAGIVGPLLLYFASTGIRRRLERGGVRGAGGFDRDEVVAHVQRVALHTLEGQPS